MPATAQIILPGLFDLPLEELDADLQGRLPNLNQILRLASGLPNQSYSIDAILRDALNLDLEPTKTHTGLPLTHAFAHDLGHDPHRLLLTQAIHLQAGMHGAVILPIQNNQKNNVDICNIIKDLNNIFNVNCYIGEVTEGLFLMQLKDFDAPTHYPHILSVLGKSANPYIEQSRPILPWYKLLNEIQMFMHQHEVNRDRTSRGLPAINSFWFWGAGERLPTPEQRLAWFCDDPLLNRFAESLGHATKACTEIGTADNLEQLIVVELGLLEALKSGSDRDLMQLLMEVDSNLLRPALLWSAKHRARLLMRAGYKLDFEMKPGAALKFWRKPRNLGSWSGKASEY